MKRKRITSTDLENIQTENFLYNRFKLLALNTFEWTGLDQLGIEERHLENWLYSNGKAIVFEDPHLGVMCLEGEGLGCNVLGDPTHYRVTGFNYTRDVPASECVVIENNKLRMPTEYAIRYFTDQLYEVVRTRDINIKTLKLPFIGVCNDKTAFTVKRIIEQIENNEGIVVIDKDVIDIDEFLKILSTGVKPYTAELTDQYHDILNEALTYLGINNANTDKRERLITNEVDANNQFIDSCANMYLESRERACKEIKGLFNIDISVEIRGGNQYEAQSNTQPTTTEQ